MPVIPVAVVGTDVVAPPGKKFGKFTRPIVRFGKPLDFSRYEGMENDRYILRSITDEIMYEIMRLSGQEYVDMYATRAKEESKKAADAAEAAAEAEPAGRADRRRPDPVPASGAVRRAATWWFGPAGTVEDRLFRWLAVLRRGAAGQRGRAQRLPRATTSSTRPRASVCVAAMAVWTGVAIWAYDDRRRRRPAPAGRRPRRRGRRRSWSRRWLKGDGLTPPCRRSG